MHIADHLGSLVSHFMFCNTLDNNADEWTFQYSIYTLEI